MAHYYVAYAIGFLLMVWGLSVSELQFFLSSLYYISARSFSFEIHQGLENAPFGQAKVCLPEEEVSNTLSVLWNPTKVINPWIHQIIRKSVLEVGTCRNSQDVMTYFYLVDYKSAFSTIKCSSHILVDKVLQMWGVVSSAHLFCHRNTRRMDSQEVGEELSVNLCPLPDPSQDPENLLKESKEDHLKGFSDFTCLPLSRWERAVIFWSDVIKPSCWSIRRLGKPTLGRPEPQITFSPCLFICFYHLGLFKPAIKKCYGQSDQANLGSSADKV